MKHFSYSLGITSSCYSAHNPINNSWSGARSTDRLSEFCFEQVKVLVRTVVSRKCAPPPPFCNLSISTKRRGGGGAYTRDATFLLRVRPPFRAWSHCQWGWGPSAGCRWERGGEMLTTLVVSWRALALRSEEAGPFRKVAGMSIVDVGGPCSL